MRKMMLGFMAAAMVCSMAACGSKQETAAPAGTPAQTQSEAQKQENAGDSQVEITWWHAMSGVNEEAIQKIADDFMAGRPDVKVNPRTRAWPGFVRQINGLCQGRPAANHGPGVFQPALLVYFQGFG